MTTFADLQLNEALCRALAAEKYETPTPIQEDSIPHLLSGGDLLGSAQTGTGKTAAFALPVLHHLMGIEKRPRKKEVRALVLTPTRELAVQVAESFRVYGKFSKLKSTVVYGGVGYGPQIKALREGVDILVATPGRLLDLFSEGRLDLKYAQFLVLDEADRMLDMGFKKDIETLIAELPKERQTLLFSATMPPEIAKLAAKILNNPKRVDVSPATMTAHNIDEQVMFVHRDKKNALLFDLLNDKEIERAIVFTRTKHVAERLTKSLNNRKVRAEAIHGNKSQNARQKSLTRFRDGRCRILVATDVAARGIDVDGITHVINYQLSNEPESYVHRIGRTARAGKSGTAVTLCDSEESGYLLDVERLLKRKLVIRDDVEYHDAELAQRHLLAKSSLKRNRSRGGRSGGGGFRGSRNSRGSGGGRRRQGGGQRRRAAPSSA